MASLMVMIDFPNISYEQLRREVISERRRDGGERSWFTEADGNRVIIFHNDLQESKTDPSCFSFKLIGVSPQDSGPDSQ